MKSSIAIFALAALVGSSFAKPFVIRSDGAPDGYTIIPMQWEGPITQGGPDVTLEGTVQEVHAQILKLNPDYKMDESANISSRDLGATLEKRNKELPPSCNPPGIGQASSQATLDNYNYLHGLFGTRCVVGGGPRVCSRIACTKGGGVFLCNDNSYSISPDCGYLSTYVGDICNQCYGTCTNINDYEAGQLFDTDNYNVIVSAQNC